MSAQFLERPVSVLVPQGPGSEKASSLRLAAWFSSGSSLPRSVCQVPGGCISGATAVWVSPDQEEKLAAAAGACRTLRGGLGVSGPGGAEDSSPWEAWKQWGLGDVDITPHYRLPHLPRSSRGRHHSPRSQACTGPEVAAGPAVPSRPTALPNWGKMATVTFSSTTYRDSYPDLVTRTPHNCQ